MAAPPHFADVVGALREHHRGHVDVASGRDLDPSCAWCRLWHAWCRQDVAEMDRLALEGEAAAIAGLALDHDGMSYLAAARRTTSGQAFAAAEALRAVLEAFARPLRRLLERCMQAACK